jgi:hypothetical protein
VSATFKTYLASLTAGNIITGNMDVDNAIASFQDPIKMGQMRSKPILNLPPRSMRLPKESSMTSLKPKRDYKRSPMRQD